MNLNYLSPDDPASWSIAQASSLLSEGVLRSTELVQAVLDRIEQVDGDIHSYLRHDAQAAMAAGEAATRRAQQGRRIGPLDGVPFAVKDNIYTSGMATTAASRVPQRHAPALHAT